MEESIRKLKLSIIVPVFNEEGWLPVVVERLMKSQCPIDREWIFVDDGSSDGSLSVLRQLKEKHGFRILEQPVHRGKGAAVTRGFREATGDFVMIQDADFEYDPEDIPKLLEPLMEDRADVVYGSRFKRSSNQVHRTYHYFVNRLLTLLSNLLSGIYLTDSHTCYKLFRTDLIHAMNLQSPRFGIDVELSAYLAKAKVRIFELPISYFPRTRLQGKKINWKDGIATIFHLVRFNWLTPPDRAFHDLPQRYQLPFYRRDEKKDEG